jgi:hypothetical protein
MMRWSYTRELEEYESERRGAFHGIVRVIGPRWHAGIRHAATMLVEEGPRFDDKDAALSWAEAQLLERVPYVEPEVAPQHLPRGSVLPSVPAGPAAPDPIPCPVCSIPMLPAPLVDHLKIAHPQYMQRPRTSVCGICNNRVRHEKIIFHLEGFHQRRIKSDTTQVVCGVCRVSVPINGYVADLQQQHYITRMLES